MLVTALLFAVNKTIRFLVFAEQAVADPNIDIKIAGAMALDDTQPIPVVKEAA